MTTHLPKGWAATTLDGIGTWFGGGTPRKADKRYWHEGTIPWISPKDMKVLRVLDSEDHLTKVATQETTASLFPAGTVLVVVRSGILLRTLPVAVNGVPATMNQDLKGLLPKSGIDPMYVAYYLIGHERAILTACCKSGTTVASIEVPRLKEFRLPLAPAHEQRRIVSKIEELFSDLDAGVAALERAKANLTRYRAAVLKSAVEGKLTASWRQKHPHIEPASQLLDRILAERRKKWEEAELAKYASTGKTPQKGWQGKYKEPVGPDTKDLPELPGQWCWATVEQLATKVVDGVHKKPDYVSDGIPFVTVRNLTAGPGISFDRLKYITACDHSEFSKRANPELGDLLISKDGTLGVTRVVRTPQIFSIFVSVALVKPVDRRLSDFMEIAFSSPTMQRQMVGKGSGLQHIHLEDLRRDCVPLPPIDEQKQLVSEVDLRLSVLVALELAVDTSSRRAFGLRQSILKRAFEGRLVPQDAKDEPASSLIEQIKSERENPKGSQSRTSRRQRVAKDTE